MKRHSLVVVVGLSLALGFVVRELSVQVTLAQGQGRGQQARPGHQPDGSFVGPDGTHYVSQQDFIESGLRCGTREADDLERSANLTGRGPGGGGGGTPPLPWPGTTQTVGVYVHIIQSSSGEGSATQSQVGRQINVLNGAFSGTGFQFNLISTDYTLNDTWYVVAPGTTAERDMKTALHQGTADDLNLYIAHIGGGLLGWATFPSNYSSAPWKDGVVVLDDSLPGGNADPYNLGDTGSHEVGHWAGLYHTFQGGCEAPGDDIEDTPYEENAASGCPLNTPSTCPGESRFIPVENYMDYSDDACMKQFTPMQYQRMKDMVGYYRYQLNPLTMRSALLKQVRESLE